MNKKFEQVKDFFNKCVWSEAKVRDAVEKSWITAEEFTKITGKNYSE